MVYYAIKFGNVNSVNWNDEMEPTKPLIFVIAWCTYNIMWTGCLCPIQVLHDTSN